MENKISLVEKLGYTKDAKLLILNCDDLGSSNSANTAIKECFDKKCVTSSTLMVPCPWAVGGYKFTSGYDIGVHLTLNCEWDNYRWSPLTKAKSLRTQDGGFYKTVPELYQNADLKEVRTELKAQIQQALDWGIDITHLDSHMGPLHFREDYFRVYLDLAVEFQLPIRMPNAEFQEILGFNYKQMAQEKGVLSPDNFAFVVDGVGSRQTVISLLDDMPNGVTECYFHPAKDTEELRAIGDDFDNRIDDFKFLIDDSNFREQIEKLDIGLIGYREIRDAMRKG